jgi:signal transduction histidine kinase
MATLADSDLGGTAGKLLRAVAQAGAILLGEGRALERCERAVRVFGETIGAHRISVLERRIEETSGMSYYLRPIVYQSPSFAQSLYPEPIVPAQVGFLQEETTLLAGRSVYLRPLRSMGVTGQKGEHGFIAFAVPIRVGGTIWGVALLVNLERDNVWSASEEVLISSLASLIGSALERERLLCDDPDLLGQVKRMEGRLLDAAGVAHDMNNLLTAIFAMLDEHFSAPAERAFLDDALHRGRELTTTLMAMARDAATQAASAVALEAIVRSAAQAVTAASGVAIDLKVQGHLPALCGFKSELLRLAANLLQNAVEAGSAHGSPVLASLECRSVAESELARTRWRSAASKPGAHVVLGVQDWGVGMNEIGLTRLFEPFYTTKPTGHGLGMVNVLSATERHCGAIAIESALARGTRVTVYLPVYRFGDVGA